MAGMPQQQLAGHVERSKSPADGKPALIAGSGWKLSGHVSTTVSTAVHVQELSASVAALQHCLMLLHAPL